MDTTSATPEQRTSSPSPTTPAERASTTATNGPRLTRRGLIRASALLAGAGLLGGIGFAAYPARAADPGASAATILVWNELALAAVRELRLGPPQTSRALAIIHTAMFDAWAAYDGRARGTQLGGTLRRPPAERTAANKAKAISHAARRAFVDLFPSQTARATALLASLGHDPHDESTDAATPVGIGNAAATALLAFRHRDGANQLGDHLPGGVPYADYTDYRPVNDPERLTDPTRWQPLRTPDGRGGTVVQQFLVPHWGLVTPFAVDNGARFRPEHGPARRDSPVYEWQAREVLELSAALNDRTKTIAEYWADGPGSETPPGHWNVIAQWVSRRDGHDLDRAVQLFFILNNALQDAAIACWDCKRAFDYIRPIGAIRHLFAGRQVRAWAGPGKGTQVIGGESWQSYLATPPFPEYVSGHSTFSRAAAEVLRRFTGSDDFGWSHTQASGSSRIEPGVTPTTAVTLSWATFSAAAEQAGQSRLYGGIHFRDGNLDGQELGQQVGTRAWAQAQAQIHGKPAGGRDR